ncbi:hypothetical protein Taro_016615 [Colocasia esculenta]|uniref:Uncharacterized protein n=1 Tax=Colocasia esculenta TaxID=4460 RepID=A0A843UWU5_COLES|nr:hypothetical protein [Colocasia esculenta]
MAGVAAGALRVLSWALVIKLGGAAGRGGGAERVVVGDRAGPAGGACGRAWTGFTWGAFHHLWVSSSSLGLLYDLGSSSSSYPIRYFVFFPCSLEIWCFMILILFAEYLKYAEVSVDALSICCILLRWPLTVRTDLGWLALPAGCDFSSSAKACHSMESGLAR